MKIYKRVLRFFLNEPEWVEAHINLVYGFLVPELIFGLSFDDKFAYIVHCVTYETELNKLREFLELVKTDIHPTTEYEKAWTTMYKTCYAPLKESEDMPCVHKLTDDDMLELIELDEYFYRKEMEEEEDMPELVEIDIPPTPERLGKHDLEKAVLASNTFEKTRYSVHAAKLDKAMRSLNDIILKQLSKADGDLTSKDMENTLSPEEMKKEYENTSCESENMTPLMVAVESRNVEKVESLLENSDIDINAKNKDGWTALHFAYSCKKILKLLVNHPNIDVNARNNDGMTPLMCVVEVDCFIERIDPKVVKLLLAHPDIDVNITASYYGKTYNAIDIAKEVGNYETVELLEKHKDTSEKMINTKNAKGITPLMYAVWFKNVDKVKVLLAKSNIDINAIDVDGHTALMYGCNLEILKLLLAHPKIEINHQDVFGETYLIQIAGKTRMYENDFEILKLLLKHPDIDVNITRNVDGLTVLDLAKKVGNYEAAELIEKHKEKNDINTKDGLGTTPLMRATMNENVDKVKALLAESNIDVNAQDNDGWTALMFGDNVEILKLLLAHPNIDINLHNKYYETALDLVKKAGNYEAAELIEKHMKNNE